MRLSLNRKDDFEVWRDHVREQAAKNALTLFLMAAGFILTWAVIGIATLWAVGHGH
jgi:hypothetical protein